MYIYKININCSKPAIYKLIPLSVYIHMNELLQGQESISLFTHSIHPPTHLSIY